MDKNNVRFILETAVFLSSFRQLNFCNEFRIKDFNTMLKNLGTKFIILRLQNWHMPLFSNKLFFYQILRIIFMAWNFCCDMKILLNVIQIYFDLIK